MLNKSKILSIRTDSSHLGGTPPDDELCDDVQHVFTRLLRTLAVAAGLTVSGPPIAADELWVAAPTALAPQSAPSIPNPGRYTAPACSRAEPCSLDTARRLLAAGDVLHLKAGVYPPILLEGLKGGADSPIVITGETSVPTKEQQQHTSIFRGDLQSRDAIEIRSSDHVHLKNVTVENAFRAGVRVHNSNNVQIDSIRVDNAGKWGIYVDYSNDVSIMRCRIVGQGSQHGIYFANSGDGARVDSSLIAEFLGSGIHVNGDMSMGGTSEVAGDGVIENLQFSHNWIYDVGKRGGAGINLDGARGAVIEHNLMTRLNAAAITLFRGDGAIGSDLVSIIGNTIVGASKSRDLVIFNRSGAQNEVSGNTFVVADKESAVLRSDAGILKMSIFGNPLVEELPFSSSQNTFWSAGRPVEVGERKLRAKTVERVDRLGLARNDRLADLATWDRLSPYVVASNGADRPRAGQSSQKYLIDDLPTREALRFLARFNPFVSAAIGQPQAARQ
ncbi:MAG: right-handed parallel beta-helix repeat-containing protein [Pseudomonadota bacterium]